MPENINASRRMFLKIGSSMILASKYLTSYSQERHAGDAQTIKAGLEEDTAYAAARRKGTASGYRGYLSKYPQGRHADEARQAIQKLETAGEKESVLSGLGFKMVPIRGGTFRVGDIVGGGLDREEPVHTVTVDGFEMSATEVTVGQFRKFVEEIGYKTEAELGDQAYVVSGGEWVRKPDANWKNPYLRQTENHPVVCVSWNDAVEFCAWLRKKTGQAIGLPTEAEWEYACRAGTETKYFTGNSEEDLDRAGWYWRNSGNSHLPGDWNLKVLTENHCGTHPVGMKPPNAWGLYDMTGNVWEWCHDRVDKDYYTSKPSENRAFRGGGWYEQAVYLRTAYRHWRRPSHSYWGLGFRIVRRP